MFNVDFNLNALCWFQGEPFEKVKERIKEKLDVPDKEFEKVRLFLFLRVFPA